MNVNQMLGLAVSGAGVLYAFTGNTMALKVFVGVTAGSALLASFGGTTAA